MVVSAVTTADDDTARAARPMDTADLIVVVKAICRSRFPSRIPIFLLLRKASDKAGTNIVGSVSSRRYRMLTEGQRVGKVALALSPQKFASIEPNLTTMNSVEVL
jgi:hypothetical protein